LDWIDFRSVPIRAPLACRKSLPSPSSRAGSSGDKIETERRSYISSRALSAAAFADAARSHWAIENNLHWTLDVTFNEDRSRLRTGHGANVVRHFALNLVRQLIDKLRTVMNRIDPDLFSRYTISATKLLLLAE
jgi:predicted transposase YbfD/YdcC